MRMMLKWHPMVAIDLHGQVASYFFPPAARPVNAQHRRRGREVARHVRPRQRAGVRPLRLDVLLARRLRPVLPGLLRHVAVAQRRDRHDVRDRRRRVEGACSGADPDGIAALAARRHRQALRRLARDDRDHGRARRGARARLPRVPPARGEPRAHRSAAPRRARARAATRAAPRSWRARCCAPASRCAAPRRPFSIARAHAYDDDAVAHAPLRRRRVRRRPRAAAGQEWRSAILEPHARARPGVRAGADREVPAQSQRRGQQRRDRGLRVLRRHRVVAARRVRRRRVLDATTRAPSPASCSRCPRRSPRFHWRSSARGASGGELLAAEVGGGIVAGRDATSAYLFSPERNGASRLAYQLLARRLPRRRRVAADRRGRPAVATRHLHRARRAQRPNRSARASTRSRARAASRSLASTPRRHRPGSTASARIPSSRSRHRTSPSSPTKVSGRRATARSGTRSSAATAFGSRRSARARSAATCHASRPS